MFGVSFACLSCSLRFASTACQYQGLRLLPQSDLFSLLEQGLIVVQAYELIS